MSALFSGWSRDLGIDLGTANTLVYARGKGIVLREPSVVAISQTNMQPLAVGLEAKRMVGRTPGDIEAIRPLKDGVIADFETTRAMLHYFIHKALRRRVWFGPQVVVGVPSGVTAVERDAVQEAAVKAGARKAFTIEEPMAAAIGAGLPVAEPVGSMIVDIGGGTSEAAVISLGGVVTHRSIRTAGDEIDEAIQNYIRSEYNLLIGDRTAEDIKIAIGSAMPLSEEQEHLVRGRDLVNGLPQSTTVNSAEIREAIREPVAAIVDAVKSALEMTPPELASDIMEFGIMLAGGGALLHGLQEMIQNETSIPTRVADDPLTCVVIGAGRALEETHVLRRLVGK